jgi:hypothetical protein
VSRRGLTSEQDWLESEQEWLDSKQERLDNEQEWLVLELDKHSRSGRMHSMEQE